MSQVIRAKNSYMCEFLVFFAHEPWKHKDFVCQLHVSRSVAIMLFLGLIAVWFMSSD